MTRRVIMIGAGGHARVLLSALRSANVQVSGCVAPERPRDRWPSTIAYLGTDAALGALNAGETILVNGIGSTRSPDLRRQVFERAKAAGLDFLAVLHAKCLLDENVTLGEGVQVLAGAIVQCDVTLGANSIVNAGAVVCHDCRIGAHAHLAPGVRLSGAVTIGDGVHVGVGATIIQGLTIGEGAMIAAGAVVVDNVPPRSSVAGTPAKPMRQLAGNE